MDYDKALLRAFVAYLHVSQTLHDQESGYMQGMSLCLTVAGNDCLNANAELEGELPEVQGLDKTGLQASSKPAWLALAFAMIALPLMPQACPQSTSKASSTSNGSQWIEA